MEYFFLIIVRVLLYLVVNECLRHKNIKIPSYSLPDEMLSLVSISNSGMHFSLQ